MVMELLGGVGYFKRSSRFFAEKGSTAGVLFHFCSPTMFFKPSRLSPIFHPEIS